MTTEAKASELTSLGLPLAVTYDGQGPLPGRKPGRGGVFDYRDFGMVVLPATIVAFVGCAADAGDGSGWCSVRAVAMRPDGSLFEKEVHAFKVQS